MARRSLGILGVATMVALIGGCASSPPGADVTVDPAVAFAEAEASRSAEASAAAEVAAQASREAAASASAEAAAAEAAATVELKNIHSITVEDSLGNKEKITFKLTDWIKGTETDLLQAAWKNATRTDDDVPMPLTEGEYTVAGGSMGSVDFSARNAAYVVGTVTVENLTTDFAASDYGSGNSQVSWATRTRREPTKQSFPMGVFRNLTSRFQDSHPSWPT